MCENDSAAEIFRVEHISRSSMCSRHSSKLRVCPVSGKSELVMTDGVGAIVPSSEDPQAAEAAASSRIELAATIAELRESCIETDIDHLVFIKKLITIN